MTTAATDKGLGVAGIDHVVLRVLDMDRALAFYTGILGLPLARRRDDLGMMHLRAGDALIDLVAVDGVLGRKGGAAPGAEGHNMDHLCLRLADFDADRVIAHLKAHGVPVGDVGVRYGATGEATSVYLKDSEGNNLELRG
ncbi:VOC family protein [Acuticoccus mangrovi]|uniref:VOC family protein n=1 Tax=Acuticoccus mangrovi TaxID=2796142 RepID=A0A934IDI8_9HYPH|nr:VOC family protein [Acuticoccus mangrovi]MBJ3774558.1 VOC family protein [Acuticoccus mangrovi]